MEYFLLFPFLIFAFFIFAMVRLELVSSFRNNLIESIYRRDDWKEQSLLFKQVSFDEMVYKFWIPLTIEAFWWKDTKFLK